MTAAIKAPAVLAYLVDRANAAGIDGCIARAEFCGALDLTRAALKSHLNSLVLRGCLQTISGGSNGTTGTYRITGRTYRPMSNAVGHVAQRQVRLVTPDPEEQAYDPSPVIEPFTSPFLRALRIEVVTKLVNDAYAANRKYRLSMPRVRFLEKAIP